MQREIYDPVINKGTTIIHPDGNRFPRLALDYLHFRIKGEVADEPENVQCIKQCCQIP